MKYVVSDIHGNHDLLVCLLRKIKFSKNDTLFVIGDIIDKGKDVPKLFELFFERIKNNVVLLAGNHEYDFVKFMTNLIKNNASDEELIENAKRYLEIDSITIQDIDNIMNLPYYYEGDDFLLVHAGVPFDEKGEMIPLDHAPLENLVYDRRFKDEGFLPPLPKCVIFGHTPTFCISDKKGKILKFQKPNTKGNSIKDYYKIDVDTGNYVTGILGCLRLDDMQEFYVSEFKNVEL